MSILFLWLKRGFVQETAGGTTLQQEILTRNGSYIATRDGSLVIARQ